MARLRRGAGPRGRIVLAQADRPLPDEDGELLQVVEDEPDGAISFALARTGRGLLAWCGETGAHRLQAAWPRILSDPVTAPAFWADRVVSTLLPLLLVERGELVLHAAAVRTEAGAVVVCGPSGRGKSTLATVLDAHGLPLLAEDIVVVTLAPDGLLVWPGPLDARVDDRTATHLGTGPETVRGKRLHGAGSEHGTGPVPLAAVVVLEPRAPAAMALRPLAPAEAVAWVFRSVLRLEPATWPAAFSRTAELVRRVPCFRARLDDNLTAVDDAALGLVARVTREPVRRLSAA